MKNINKKRRLNKQILKNIRENTNLKISESYWNFGKHPAELKRYWLKRLLYQPK